MDGDTQETARHTVSHTSNLFTRKADTLAVDPMARMRLTEKLEFFPMVS